jgi:hypothetical protein
VLSFPIREHYYGILWNVNKQSKTNFKEFIFTHGVTVMAKHAALNSGMTFQCAFSNFSYHQFVNQGIKLFLHYDSLHLN